VTGSSTHHPPVYCDVWAALKGYLDEVTATAAAPVIEKYTGVIAAADVFTESTTLWVMESIRLDLGYGSWVHPDGRHPYQGGHMSVATKPCDPIGDHLLTPQNAAMVVIDYQPSQFAGVRSIDQNLLLENIISSVKIAKLFGVPIVHSTINVPTGRGQPTVPELAELLEDNPPVDRTTTNAWEDADFVAAVRATGRRKLIACALRTEICLAFHALDALRQGYDVYPVVDAIGGTSEEAHRAGLERVVQGGGQPISWVALACELQRDWAREETAADVAGIVLTERLLQE
jgi:nicotinamidase-related amidase